MRACFIATLMARGLHPGPVFGLFGAAIAAARIMGLDAEQLNSTIALCASLAGGNPEAARSGGKALREGAAVRNAMLAVALAQAGHVAGETVLEGEAGFYHAYAGNNQGRLAYSFTGDTRADLQNIAADLGRTWLFLETLYRIYFTPGYNLAHVDVTAKLCEEHGIRHQDVERVEAVVNWLETQYPSPAFPSRREDGAAKPGSTAYFTAYGIVKRGYPVLRGQKIDPAEDPPEVLELMKRVTLIPSHQMTLFGPRFTIYTRDGKSYTKQSTGREFIWDFEEQARRIRDVVPGLPIPAAQFETMIATCRNLDREARADKLVQLTLRPPA